MYPVTYSAEVPIEGRDRLSVLLRIIFAIPALIVAYLYAIVAYLAAIVAWFSIVFTGKYPEGLYDFVAKAVRMFSRANSYFYLATDQSPPLNGDDDPSYPIRIGTPPPLAEYNRLKTGLRIIFGIPVYILAVVQGIIVEVVALIAWFTILFTGKMPEGLVKPLRDGLAYSTRAATYFLLMTEDYPPFSEEAGSS